MRFLRISYTDGGEPREILNLTSQIHWNWTREMTEMAMRLSHVNSSEKRVV